MTVATSAVEQMTTISNAPTSVISREYNKLERNLQEQIKKRFKLQQQIKKMYVFFVNISIHAFLLFRTNYLKFS